MTKTKKFRTTWEKLFIWAVVILLVEVLVFIGWKVFAFFQQRTIDNKKAEIQTQEQQLATYESAVEYDRFLAVKDLEAKSVDMPWFEHIPKILAMFQDLKNLDSSSSNMIKLSDFFVSLEEISLKWSISSLKALYYNPESGTFKALLDRFEDLDFIKDMRIKSYNKVDDRNFEFVLNANVVVDDK